MTKHKKLEKELTAQTEQFLGAENVETVVVMMGRGYFAHITNKKAANKLKKAWAAVDGQSVKIRTRHHEGEETRDENGELVGYEHGPVKGYTVTAIFDDE